MVEDCVCTCVTCVGSAVEYSGVDADVAVVMTDRVGATVVTEVPELLGLCGSKLPLLCKEGATGVPSV